MAAGDSMGPILSMLLPVAALILVGMVLRLAGFLDPLGWAALEKLVYWVLFPCLLFLELARVDLGALPLLTLALAMAATQLAMAALAYLVFRVGRIPGPAATSLLQGVVRWNSYLAVALAPALHGPIGAAVAAVGVAVMTPMANLVSVTALARLGRPARPVDAAKALILNPLVLSCLAGVAWAATGRPVPTLVADTGALLARGTLAIGLLVVGAALRPIPMQARAPLVLLAIIGKLAVCPAIGLALGWALGLEPALLAVLALLLGVPTSPTSTILARMMGGDEALMAAIVTAQVAAVAFTLPILLGLIGPVQG